MALVPPPPAVITLAARFIGSPAAGSPDHGRWNCARVSVSGGRLPGPGAGTFALLLRESAPTGDSGIRLLHRAGLTARQAGVLAHATSGATNSQIATRLGISVRTVEKHLESAMDRLGVVNRVQATQLARDVLLRPTYRMAPDPLAQG